MLFCRLESQCSYKRKDYIAALLLQIFLGYYGAMRFYLGYLGMGLAQIFLFISPCFLVCCLNVAVDADTAKGCGHLIFSGFYGALGIWWIVDIVFAATGLPDANGIETEWWRRCVKKSIHSADMSFLVLPDRHRSISPIAGTSDKCITAGSENSNLRVIKTMCGAVVFAECVHHEWIDLQQIYHFTMYSSRIGFFGNLRSLVWMSCSIFCGDTLKEKDLLSWRVHIFWSIFIDKLVHRHTAHPVWVTPFSISSHSETIQDGNNDQQLAHNKQVPLFGFFIKCFDLCQWRSLSTLQRKSIISLARLKSMYHVSFECT